MTNNILKIYWDTLIGAKVLDENEKSAGLKQQYIQKIDPSVEKYSIDHLFENVEYAAVDPDIFALYAATDAMMTYKLYKWQKDQFMQPENSGIYKLFRDIEMPLVAVLAEMELKGIEVDQEYADLLSKKFHRRLDAIGIISQYGGPDGELGASMRYLSQRYAMPYAEAKGVLTDIGTDASKRTRVRSPCKY